MGRSGVKPIKQPDETSCGPAAIKHALAVFDVRKSIASLTKLCRTNANGTSTKNMIAALTKLGFSVLIVQEATLHHLQSALRYPPSQVRAVLVSYLYDLNDRSEPHPESGHWALVSSFLPSKSRIVILDSSVGKKKSYDWADFRTRWMDYDLKRKRVGKRGNHFQLIRKWQSQLLMVIAKNRSDLPDFSIPTARIFTAQTLAETAA